MGTREINVQKIVKQYESEYEKAYVYFSIVSALSGLGLQRKELELLSFVGVHKEVSLELLKSDFCSKYDTTENVLANLKSKLLKKGLVISYGDGLKLIPEISLNFSLPILLNIVLDEDRTDNTGNSKEVGDQRRDSREGDKKPMESSESSSKGKGTD